jgi:hypothetical protein
MLAQQIDKTAAAEVSFCDTFLYADNLHERLGVAITHRDHQPATHGQLIH